jgi:hypothetical protein
MKGQDAYSPNRKLAVGVAIVGLALVTLLCKLDGAAAGEWKHLDENAWVALEVLRGVILAGWQLVPSYHREEARCLQNLLQIVECFWQVLFVVAA